MSGMILRMALFLAVALILVGCVSGCDPLNVRCAVTWALEVNQ